MIKIENVEVVGWEHVIRGMRNPKNSWDRSDTTFCEERPTCAGCPANDERGKCGFKEFDNMPPIIGPNDHNLMMNLASGGPVHAKYRRMITVYMDITAPLYWWKEFDTYKVGTVANSCSTMHKIHERDLTIEDFSVDQCDTLVKDLYIQHIIPTFNMFRRLFCEAAEKLKVKDRYTDAERKHITAQKKRFWYNMIQLLSSSYNQKRTIMLNYEVLVGMYKWRKDHKLDEWREFCKWIESLPYSELITGEVKE